MVTHQTKPRTADGAARSTTRSSVDRARHSGGGAQGRGPAGRLEGGGGSDGRDTFGALADPTRRAILDGLRSALRGRGPATGDTGAGDGGDATAGGRTAGDIAGDFSISRPAVSRHLRVLAGAGLVRVVKHGRERRYHLEAGPLEHVDAWVARYRLLWSATLMRLKEHVEDHMKEPADGLSADAPPEDPVG